MSSRFGPTRGELRFRLLFSIAGLGFLTLALMFRGLPQGPAMFEVVGIAGAFLGGTAIWTARKLLKRDHP